MTQTTKSEDGAKPVVLGRVSGLYGVKGWVRVYSYTEPREAILRYSNCLIGQSSDWQAAEIAEGRKHGKSVVLRFFATEDRDAAAEMIGADIAVARDELPTAGPDEYYWTDLEGLEVVHRDGRKLGNVAYMLATGVHDVMVVQGEEEILIPFVPERIILDVNLPDGVIQVDWEWD